MGYRLGHWGTSSCRQLQVSYYLTSHLEVGVPDRSRSHFRMPMRKRRCLQPSKSALQPCRPWSTNINQVVPGISELKSPCTRCMSHRFTLRSERYRGLQICWVCLPTQLIFQTCCRKHSASLYVYSLYMFWHTDRLPSHKSRVGGGVAWGINFHAHVHTSATLTSHLAILDDTSGLRLG